MGRKDRGAASSGSSERSRSRDHHKSKKSSSYRDKDRGSRRDGKGREDRGTDNNQRGGRRNMGNTKREDFRFDSPPKDHELTKGIMAAAASIGGGTIANAHSILQSI